MIGSVPLHMVPIIALGLALVLASIGVSVWTLVAIERKAGTRRRTYKANRTETVIVIVSLLVVLGFLGHCIKVWSAFE